MLLPDTVNSLATFPASTAARVEAWLAAGASLGCTSNLASAEAARQNGDDAVMITTPIHLHFDCAKAFLEAVIHVLCDKPLTNELAEADALVGLANRTSCVFGVSYAIPCFPVIRQTREIVAGSGIGKINQIRVEFQQDWITPEDVSEPPT